MVLENVLDAVFLAYEDDLGPKLTGREQSSRYGMLGGMVAPHRVDRNLHTHASERRASLPRSPRPCALDTNHNAGMPGEVPSAGDTEDILIAQAT